VPTREYNGLPTVTTTRLGNPDNRKQNPRHSTSW